MPNLSELKFGTKRYINKTLIYIVMLDIIVNILTFFMIIISCILTSFIIYFIIKTIDLIQFYNNLHS